MILRKYHFFMNSLQFKHTLLHHTAMYFIENSFPFLRTYLSDMLCYHFVKIKNQFVIYNLRYDALIFQTITVLCAF